MKRKKIVVLTGAGISAESGLSTFRDAGGLWEGHNVMDVASPEGWRRNRKLVLEFYNQRRRQLANAEPNEAHKALVRLEEMYDVTIVTQNVDDLHERAGSNDIIHLHGELNKSQSTLNPELIYDLNGMDINEGDKCELGSQLRPFIVWFGELVPKMDDAVKAALEAKIFIVIGTSLVVYPAAGLMQFAEPDIKKYLIDPVEPELYFDYPNLTHIRDKATAGTVSLVNELMK
ncbi:MAG: NAD-dependent deacylase [Ignavibacteria bacterium]|nr:NAD-dependent deacylase [Ignavibacteria bacterium]